MTSITTTIGRYLKLQNAIAAGISTLIIFLVTMITAHGNGILGSLLMSISLLFVLWVTVKIVDNAKAIAEWFDSRAPRDIVYIDRIPLDDAIDKAKSPTNRLDPHEGLVQTPSSIDKPPEENVGPYQIPS
jgi:hypothetical protein